MTTRPKLTEAQRLTLNMAVSAGALRKENGRWVASGFEAQATTKTINSLVTLSLLEVDSDTAEPTPRGRQVAAGWAQGDDGGDRGQDASGGDAGAGARSAPVLVVCPASAPACPACPPGAFDVYFDFGRSGPMPFADEVALFEAAGLRLRMADLREELASTEDLASETLAELRSLISRPEYHATAQELVTVATLLDGEVVHQLFTLLQGGVGIARKTGASEFEGSVKLSGDVVRRDDHGIVEHRLELSSVAKGSIKVDFGDDKAKGTVVLDDQGRIVPPAEAVRQLPLMLAGERAA